MLTTTDIISEVNKILESEISDKTYEKLFSLKEELTDAVEKQIAYKYKNTPFYNPSLLDKDRDQVILALLGHLAANPSKPEQKEAIINSYVCINENDHQVNQDIINYNEESILKFVDELIVNSKEEGARYLGDKNADLSKIFILHGWRGIGKTAFINYMVTNYNDYMNDSNVIWVRINVNNEFGGDDPDIIHWLQSKAVVTVLKYYSTNYLAELQKYISETYSKLGKISLIHALENLQLLIDKCKAGIQPTIIYKDLISLLLAQTIVHFFVDKGYSFIYIIDGFDKVDKTPKYSTRFNNIKNRLTTIFTPDTALGGCYILVTRDETLPFLYESFQRALSLARRRSIDYYEIENPKIEKILDKRFEYIKKCNLIKKYGSNELIHDIIEEIDNYKDYLIILSNSVDFSYFTSLIDDIFENNNREKMQLMQLCFFDYKKRSRKKTYKLVESMCLAGYKYPPKYYTYICKNGEIESESDIKEIDNNFIPLIFRFPYAAGNCFRTLPHAKSYLLAPFRIIQLFMNKLNTNFFLNKRYAKAYSDDLFDILTSLFNYNKNIINLILSEFIQFGLIRINNQILPIENDIDYSSVEIVPLPKINYLHINRNKYTMITAVAYLNMCAMRTQISTYAINDEIPFIKALNTIEASSLTYWNIRKITNTIALYRSLTKANSIEKEFAVNTVGAEIDISSHIIFRAIPEMKIPISDQIKYMINAMPDKRALVKYLSEYISKWCEDFHH